MFFLIHLQNPNDKQVGSMSYKINTGTDPYQLIIYRENTVLEGVFAIGSEDRVTICLNMEENDYQPTEITDDHLVMVFYRVEEGE